MQNTQNNAWTMDLLDELWSLSLLLLFLLLLCRLIAGSDKLYVQEFKILTLYTGNLRPQGPTLLDL